MRRWTKVSYSSIIRSVEVSIWRRRKNRDEETCEHAEIRLVHTFSVISKSSWVWSRLMKWPTISFYTVKFFSLFKVLTVDALCHLNCLYYWIILSTHHFLPQNDRWLRYVKSKNEEKIVKHGRPVALKIACITSTIWGRRRVGKGTEINYESALSAAYLKGLTSWQGQNRFPMAIPKPDLAQFTYLQTTFIFVSATKRLCHTSRLHSVCVRDACFSKAYPRTPPARVRF